MISFICKKCGKEVATGGNIGTHNRNHCPFCLYSLHVDIVPGDRKEKCGGLMAPIGLTFKNEGEDKYGKKKQGELMLVHLCEKCRKVNINRIAADDDANEILNVFESSKKLGDNIKADLKVLNIHLLNENDSTEIHRQLFGHS